MSMSGHCKHGTYVGGCGIDWMCGACESGEPDLTLRQAIADVNQRAHDLWELYDALYAAGILAGRGEVEARRLADEIVDVDSVYANGLHRAIRVRDNIAEMANGLDDDNYLARIHREAEREAYEYEQERRAADQERAEARWAEFDAETAELEAAGAL